MRCDMHQIDETDDEITLCVGNRLLSGEIEMFNLQAERPLDAEEAEQLGCRLIAAANRLREAKRSMLEGYRAEAAVRRYG